MKNLILMLLIAITLFSANSTFGQVDSLPNGLYQYLLLEKFDYSKVFNKGEASELYEGRQINLCWNANNPPTEVFVRRIFGGVEVHLQPMEGVTYKFFFSGIISDQLYFYVSFKSGIPVYVEMGMNGQYVPPKLYKTCFNSSCFTDYSGLASLEKANTMFANIFFKELFLMYLDSLTNGSIVISDELIEFGELSAVKDSSAYNTLTFGDLTIRLVGSLQLKNPKIIYKNGQYILSGEVEEQEVIVNFYVQQGKYEVTTSFFEEVGMINASCDFCKITSVRNIER